MNTVFGILLGFIVLASSPSWGTTFKDGKISPENIILDSCNSDYKDNCNGTEQNAFGTYQGEFQKNKRHGQGEWVLKDGTKYSGQFRDGIHFTGNAFYKNGQVWNGNFFDEHDAAGHLNPIGDMTINYPDGSKYVGRTLGGDRHGYGTYTAKDGQIEKGVFEFSQLVVSASSTLVDFQDWEDSSICARATIDGKWEVAEKLLSAVVEAKKRGLSCGVQEAQAAPPTVVKKVTEEQVAPPIAVGKSTNADASFWSKTDQFLGMIADGISKKDAITGLRTLDSPFHNEEDHRRRGAETLKLILNKARKDGVKVFAFDEPEYQRVRGIVDRLIDASHYKNHKHKVKYEVIDYEDFNALAFGGGYFVVFTGLMKQTNDDELAYVIAHELAHNTAGHIEESFFLRVKDVFGDKPTGAYTTSFKNIHEQEADRIAIVYTALAGFDPRASATIWEKQYQGIEQYAFYRSHPANPQRVQANRYAANLVMKHFTRGVVHPDVEKVLKCNELFCNTSMSKIAEDGSGGGVLKTLEVLGDYYIKNKQAKEEKKRQAQEIAQAQQLLAKKRLETPPKIKWDGTVAYRYEGKINRHNQISGNSFGFSRDLSQGKFAYNFNNQLVVGNLVLHSTNKDGYWFRWNDKWGQGFVLLQEYTDGSMRGNIYMDDGTNPGKLMGQFGGFRK